jgi:hypothetical protein
MAGWGMFSTLKHHAAVVASENFLGIYTAESRRVSFLSPMHIVCFVVFKAQASIKQRAHTIYVASRRCTPSVCP